MRMRRQRRLFRAVNRQQRGDLERARQPGALRRRRAGGDSARPKKQMLRIRKQCRERLIQRGLAASSAMIACNSPLADSERKMSVARIRRSADKISMRSKGISPCSLPSSPLIAAGARTARQNRMRPMISAQYSALRQGILPAQINDRAQHRPNSETMTPRMT